MSYEVHTMPVREGNRTVQKQVVAPSWTHYSKEDHKETRRRTFTFNGVPAGLLQSTARYAGQLDRATFGRVHLLTLKLRVRVQGSPSVLVPVPYFFDRIELRGNSSNTIYQTWFNDTLMAHYSALRTDPELQACLRDINVDGSPDNFLGYTKPIPVGVSKTFYMPFPDSFLNTMMVHLQNQVEDLRFDFYPSGSIIKSGSGSVVIDELALVCDTDELTLPREEANMIRSAGFLEPIPVIKPNFQCQVGKNRIDLSPVTGKISHFLLVVRPAGSQSGQGWSSIEALGENSTLDLLDSTDQSEYGWGVAVDTALLRNEEISSHQLKNSVFSTKNKPMYILPIAQNIKASIKGAVNSCKLYRGDREQFVFEIKDVQQKEIQRLATSSGAVASAGWYYISYKGARTQALAFNASASAIKSAIEALPHFQKKSITVAVSNGFDANSGVVDITITDPEGSGSTDLDLLAVDSTLNTSVVVSQLQPPVHALPAGLHDVYLYAFRHRRAIYKDGKFEVADL